jgi:tRNA A58 N-methylase Trm61
LTCPGTKVTNLIFTKQDVAWVPWKYIEDVDAAIKVNVVVAAYVTTQARLKLYEYLSKLGSLFCTVIQTRSTSFRRITSPRKIKTGDYQRELTDQWKEYDNRI